MKRDSKDHFNFLMRSFYKGNKVLVTGGTGTIGTVTVKRLIAYGSEVPIPAYINE